VESQGISIPKLPFLLAISTSCSSFHFAGGTVPLLMELCGTMYANTAYASAHSIILIRIINAISRSHMLGLLCHIGASIQFQ
jgi:hypothetical protein